MSYNSTTTTAVPHLSRGWIPQPNGRGTLDILQSCLATIILCTWSVLFLNVPAEHEGPWEIFKTKARWMLFTIFFPEVLTAVAAEQWRSACQAVEDFSRLEKEWKAALGSVSSSKETSPAYNNLSRLRRAPWTMRHAFFADMGGFHLKCPGFPAFPVDSHQLVYLVEHNHIEYPEIEAKAIWDRNKADTFARMLTLVQIIWFLIQAIGRWVKHLALSTFELSCLAFIFCSINTFFFFRHKPRDVETPSLIACNSTITKILAGEGDRPKPYTQTPLDFVKPPVSRTSLIAPFWFAVRVCFDWGKHADELPVKVFGNSTTTPPRGIRVADIAYGNIFTIAYFGIHLAGWNFTFPTRAEQILWRVSSLTLFSLLIIYLFAVAFGTAMASRLARMLFNNHDATTILGVAILLPRWIAVMIHSPFLVTYGLARGYIIIEGFSALRALPISAFASVNWSNFVPHL